MDLNQEKGASCTEIDRRRQAECLFSLRQVLAVFSPPMPPFPLPRFSLPLGMLVGELRRLGPGLIQVLLKPLFNAVLV